VQSDQFARHPRKVKPELRTEPLVPAVQVPLSNVRLLKFRELLSDRKLFLSVVSWPVEDDPVQGLVQAEPNAVNEQAASSKAIDKWIRILFLSEERFGTELVGAARNSSIQDLR